MVINASSLLIAGAKLVYVATIFSMLRFSLVRL